MAGTNESTSPTAIAAAVFERINAHDLEGMGKLGAEGIREEWPLVGRLEGWTAVRDHFSTLFGSMPDLHVEVLRMATSGETVFVHWRAKGTFTGTPFEGICATGRPIELRGTDCLTIRDRKIVENFIAYDGMSFAVQAGILPRHGTITDRVMTAAINTATRVRKQLRV